MALEASQCHARGEFCIGDREAFTDGGQGVVIGTHRLCGVDGGRPVAWLEHAAAGSPLKTKDIHWPIDHRTMDDKTMDKTTGVEDVR